MPELPDPIQHTVAAIYAAYERAADRDERTYLGASVIGEPCERKLWLAFRWAFEPETFSGRMLRLFETGHEEEARIIEDLGAAGIIVWDRDPETGEQWEVEEVGGHFRGHLDGIAARVPEAPGTRHLIEIKTHNEKSYKELVSKGVAASKPMHFAQMQVYMHLTGLQRALYVAVNKNTDELYAERVAYDMGAATALLGRASRVINAPRPPAPLVTWACDFCPARGVCQDGVFARRNCRTCIYSTPAPGGWVCELQDRELTARGQQAGCPSHRYIPDLVPGEQVDVKGDDVVYLLRSGASWVDGGAA